MVATYSLQGSAVSKVRDNPEVVWFFSINARYLLLFYLKVPCVITACFQN